MVEVEYGGTKVMHTLASIKDTSANQVGKD